LNITHLPGIAVRKSEQPLHLFTSHHTLKSYGAEDTVPR